MSGQEHCVGTFHATYAVLRVEKDLKQLGLTVKMVPVPRQISSNCGIALRFSCADLAQVRRAIDPVREDLEGLWQRDAEGHYRRME